MKKIELKNWFWNTAIALGLLCGCATMNSCIEEEDEPKDERPDYGNDEDSGNQDDDDDKWYVIECTWCKGSGECRKCNGDGLDAYDRTCSSCDGTGICSHCDGTGEIWFQ